MQGKRAAPVQLAEALEDALGTCPQLPTSSLRWEAAGRSTVGAICGAQGRPARPSAAPAVFRQPGGCQSSGCSLAASAVTAAPARDAEKAPTRAASNLRKGSAARPAFGSFSFLHPHDRAEGQRSPGPTSGISDILPVSDINSAVVKCRVTACNCSFQCNYTLWIHLTTRMELVIELQNQSLGHQYNEETLLLPS